MSRTATRRLLAQSPLGLFPELAPACKLPSRCLRAFSQTYRRKADEDSKSSPPIPPSKPASSLDDFMPSPSLNPKAGRRTGTGGNASMKSLASAFGAIVNQNQGFRAQKLRSTLLHDTNYSPNGEYLGAGAIEIKYEEPHHFHIYAHRHNTHITLTTPARAPLISVSCGNIGFRKSARKHYDSAFQLASYVLTRMQDTGINAQIKQIEVQLRGFGAGREAVTKAILGLEGKNMRHKIIKVADATRLKFGGTRSRKPRRLG